MTAADIKVREPIFHRHGCVVCRWSKYDCVEYGDEMTGMVMILKGCGFEQAKKIVASMGYKVSLTLTMEEGT